MQKCCKSPGPRQSFFPVVSVKYKLAMTSTTPINCQKQCNESILYLSLDPKLNVHYALKCFSPLAHPIICYPFPFYILGFFPITPFSPSAFYSPLLVNSCWILSFVLFLIALSHPYFLLNPFFIFIHSSFLILIYLLHKQWYLLMLNSACRPKIIVSQKPSGHSSSVFHILISEKRFDLAEFPLLYF